MCFDSVLISNTNQNYARVVIFGVYFSIPNFIEICEAFADMKPADRQSYPPHLFIYNLLYLPHCVLNCPLIYHSPSKPIPPEAKVDRAV
jgi:hypothetical protein